MERLNGMNIMSGLLLAFAAASTYAATPIVLGGGTTSAKPVVTDTSQVEPTKPAVPNSLSVSQQLRTAKESHTRQVPSYQTLKPTANVSELTNGANITGGDAPVSSPSKTGNPSNNQASKAACNCAAATKKKSGKKAGRAKRNVYKPVRVTEGGPVFQIMLYSPHTEITLFNGTCLSKAYREMHQQLIDRGIDIVGNSRLHPVYAATQEGRVKGCWYYDRRNDFYRVMLENGQGEDFSREQLDRLR